MSSPDSPGMAQRILSDLRWAFVLARRTCPRLFVVYGLNAGLLASAPAGIALSVRGLVNGVDLAIDGMPLGQTSAWAWLVFGFLMTLLGSACGALHKHLAQRFELELRQRLHLDILCHNAAMPLQRVEDPKYRDLHERAQWSPETHVAQLYAATLSFLTKVVQGTSLLIILIYIEPLIFVLLLPVGIPFLIFQWRLSQRRFREHDERAGKERWMGYYRGILSRLEQAGEIRFLGLAPELIRRWERIMREFRAITMRFNRLEFLGNLCFAIGSVVAVYLAMAHAMVAIVDGQMTIGDLAIFGSAATQLRSLVEQAVVDVTSMRWELLYTARLREFFATRPDPKDQPAGRCVDLNGRIEFRGISFSYPGTSTPVLQNLSFSIEPGETIALVGENGAGKSTVAKLLAGLYQPDAGELMLDGHDMRSLDLMSVREQIACVFQNFGRYAASAADNIAFGDWARLAADQAAIQEAARAADVDRLIRELPQGYATILGREFGSADPSGGQWQRLAIARQTARNARILILDEPTANLDVRAEAEMFRQFRKLARNRTTLLISHRFSTVTMADRILVIEDGRIVESGSHDELISRDGHYAGLFTLASRPNPVS